MQRILLSVAPSQELMKQIAKAFNKVNKIDRRLKLLTMAFAISCGINKLHEKEQNEKITYLYSKINDFEHKAKE